MAAGPAEGRGYQASLALTDTRQQLVPIGHGLVGVQTQLGRRPKLVLAANRSNSKAISAEIGSTSSAWRTINSRPAELEPPCAGHLHLRNLDPAQSVSRSNGAVLAKVDAGKRSAAYERPAVAGLGPLSFKRSPGISRAGSSGHLAARPNTTLPALAKTGASPALALVAGRFGGLVADEVAHIGKHLIIGNGRHSRFGSSCTGIATVRRRSASGDREGSHGGKQRSKHGAVTFYLMPA